MKIYYIYPISRGTIFHLVRSTFFLFTDPHAGQDVRTGGRNADVSFAEGLVAVGPAKRPHRQITLSGHLPVSAHQSTG